MTDSEKQTSNSSELISLFMNDDSIINNEPNDDTVIIRQVTCPNCKYTWQPRKQSPKQCPRCHVYLKSTLTSRTYYSHPEFKRMVTTCADLDCPYLEWKLEEDVGRKCWVITLDKTFYENMIRKRE